MEILKTKEECDHVQFLITEQCGPGRVSQPEIEEIDTLSLGNIYNHYIGLKILVFLSKIDGHN